MLNARPYTPLPMVARVPITPIRLALPLATADTTGFTTSITGMLGPTADATAEVAAAEAELQAMMMALQPEFTKCSAIRKDHDLTNSEERSP